MPTTCHEPTAGTERPRCELIVTVEEVAGRPVPEPLARLLAAGDAACMCARSGSEWAGGRRNPRT